MTIQYRTQLLPLGCLSLLLAASFVSSAPIFSFSHDTSCELHRSGIIPNNGHSFLIPVIDDTKEYCNWRRRSFLSILLSARGGASPVQGDYDFYNTNDDEELLDSIFFNNDKLTNSVREKAPIRSVKRGGPSYNNNHVDRKSSKQQQQQQQQSDQIQLEHQKQMLFNLAMSMQDAHTSTVQSLIKGNAAHIPPALFGQTMLQEKAACNKKFLDVTSDSYNIDIKAELNSIKNGQGDELETAGPSFRHIEDPDLLSYWGLTPEARLYGGAQYHRVLRYYHHLLLTAPLPQITDDEVALLSNSITDVHDASDLMRAVALLVQQKLELVMEDILADMTRRLLYVMERQWELVEYSMTLHRPMGAAGNVFGKSGDKSRRESKLYSRYGPEFTTAEKDLMSVLSVAFHKFAQERATDAHKKSAEDIKALLRYVTWDMGRARTRNRNGEYQNSKGGYVTEIQIVREDPPVRDDMPNEPLVGVAESTSNRSSRNRKQKKKSAYSDSTKRRMIARGGAAIGSGRKKSQLIRDDDNETVASIRADQENAQAEEDQEYEDDSVSTSLVLTSQTSPMFSGDDEVLALLFDTLSTTLLPKSESQGRQTQTAIEELTAYITDRMRLDLSGMIRSKFNTFFLLPFYEDLGIYLRRELDSYLASLEG
ncbi:hypothetical protein ACHAWT_010464 [Skeletonema menzelii]